ncbi:MAG TPA: glycosyltransferase family 39 protein [Acidimicrobiales bacterium]|nr:glycosyltransferase family 39 protein [Acidimicrobiales bacterium]
MAIAAAVVAAAHAAHGPALAAGGLALAAVRWAGSRRPAPVLVVAMATALVAGAGQPRDAALLGGLFALGVVPLVAAGVVPSLVVRGHRSGRRDAVLPALLVAAGAGTAASLAVLVAPDAVAGVHDGRLAPLAPYVAVGMVALGLGGVLVHHAVASGRHRTAAAVAGIALAAQAALLVTGAGPATEGAVDALLGGAAVLLVGLVVATTAAAPFPFRVPPEEAGDGPLLVGPALVGLTVLGLVVRLLSLRPLWIDEAATARMASGSFASMVRAGLHGDAHPPLYLVLAWLCRHGLGHSALALRLPSLAAGTALVPVLYVAGRRLYGRRTGLAAAMIGALAPPLVWFSTEARPEALAALLAVLAVVALARALDRRSPADWVLAGLAAGALLWSHQLAVAQVAVLAVAAGACVWRDRRDGQADPALARGVAVGFVVVAAAAGLLVTARSGLGPPRLPLPLEFATAAAPSGGRAVFPILSTALTALLGFHPAGVGSRLLAFWPLGILAALLVLGRARSRRSGLLLALAAAPFAALFVAQVAGAPRQPAFALAWTATALPFVALLAGRALSVFGGPWTRARLVAAGVAAVLLVAVADQGARVEPERRFDVRPAVSAVAASARPGDVVAYDPQALGDYVAEDAGAARPVPVATVTGPGPGPEAPHVFVVGAFALGRGDETVQRTVDLVRRLSAVRPLLDRRGTADVQVWVFGPPRPAPKRSRR